MKRSWRIFIYLVLLLYMPISLNAQATLGGRLSLVLQLGTHINGAGLRLGAFYHNNGIQIQADLRSHYYLRHLGPKAARAEWQLSLGLGYAFGKEQTDLPSYWHLLSNVTGRPYHIGYAYNYYLDRLSRQSTGTVALQVKAWELLTENDALAFQGKDRFRTGAIQLAWQRGDHRLALNSLLWTGDIQSPEAVYIKEPGDYPCRYGYRDLSGNWLGRHSHGILALQWQYAALPFHQLLSADVGIDAEQIRHFLQNKWMHDRFSFPNRSFGSPNPHLPMLDREGQPYVYKSGQQIRPLRFFGKLAFNPPLFY